MRTTGFVVILLSSAVLFAAAPNAGNSGARSNIFALEYPWDQAQERGDIKALSAIFDDSRPSPPRTLYGLLGPSKRHLGLRGQPFDLDGSVKFSE